jgi:hypothetical protein
VTVAQPGLCMEAHDCDLEGDDTPGGRSAEDEPSLGSTAVAAFTSQADWAKGNGDDREGDPCCDDREDEMDQGGDEHDGREPDNDPEPSLGWPERMSQTAQTGALTIGSSPKSRGRASSRRQGGDRPTMPGPIIPANTSTSTTCASTHGRSATCRRRKRSCWLRGSIGARSASIRT